MVLKPKRLVFILINFLAVV